MKEIELNETPLEQAEFTVLDFETTGTSAKFERAIEIGMVKIKNLKIVDTYQSFFHPGRSIPPFITSLTGITNDDVAKAPKFEDAAQEIIDFIDDSVICAHNLQFDRGFLHNEIRNADLLIPENAELCTLKLSRQLFPELKSKSLGSMVKHLRIFHKGIHRALGDATVTAKLLLKLIEKVKEEQHVSTLDELIRLQNRPSSGGKGFSMIKKQLADDYVNLPDTPGVYFFKNRNDEIVYIGKAKSLKNRVKNYFASTAAKKAKQIVRKASKLQYIETNSELTALLTEARLIKKFDPPMNSQLKGFSNTYFVKITSSEDFPKLKVTSKFEFDGDDYYGPFNKRETAAELKEIAEFSFQMRECTEKEYGKKKRCYLADIKRCLAPCEDLTVKDEYDLEISKAVDLLKGLSQSAINRLLEKMKEYSEKQKYEEAAKIRDKVNLLLTHVKKSSILSEPINSASAVIEIIEYGKKDYILISDGKLTIKDDPAEEKDYFINALNDYFDGSLISTVEMQKKDEEKLKISLSWLVKNRTKANIYYLADYESKDELFYKMSI